MQLVVSTVKSNTGPPSPLLSGHSQEYEQAELRIGNIS
jgi:hypothetical protein